MGRIVDVPQIRQVDVPHITRVDKHVEVPHHQVVEKIVEIPMVGDEIEGMQNHTHNHLPVERQQHPAEVHHHHEVGMPFDTHYAGAAGGQQFAGQQFAGGASMYGGSTSMGQPAMGSTMLVQPQPYY